MSAHQDAHTHDQDHGGHDHAHAHDHPHAIDWKLWIKTGLLIGMGLYFVFLIVSGNLANYINQRFAWLSWVAAAIFLLTGGYSLFRLLTTQRGGHHHHDHDHSHDGQTHGSIAWGVLGIIAIPLALGMLVPSRPLGAEAINGGVSFSAVEAAQAVTLSIPPLDRNVLDWLRAFNREPDMMRFNGQPVDVVGFIYREPTFAEDQFMIARFTVSCCVADASAIGLPVTWADAHALEQGGWVRVHGTLQTGDFRGERLPIVIASSIEMVAQPAHPYLYP